MQVVVLAIAIWQKNGRSTFSCFGEAKEVTALRKTM
jgi:hypothetical protein